MYFFQEVCHLSNASIRLLLVVQKLPGVTVHSQCVESLKVSYSDAGEGGVAVNCEKPQFFLNTLYLP